MTNKHQVLVVFSMGALSMLVLVTIVSIFTAMLDKPPKEKESTVIKKSKLYACDSSSYEMWGFCFGMRLGYQKGMLDQSDFDSKFHTALNSCLAAEKAADLIHGDDSLTILCKRHLND